MLAGIKRRILWLLSGYIFIKELVSVYQLYSLLSCFFYWGDSVIESSHFRILLRSYHFGCYSEMVTLDLFYIFKKLQYLQLYNLNNVNNSKSKSTCSVAQCELKCKAANV